MEAQAPERKTSEEERFQTDYFAYFEQPENATRYTPAVYFLNEAFKQSFSLVDLGCGNGALLKYLSNRCDYLGIDHSEAAVKYCLELYPQRKFVVTDLCDFLRKLIAENKKFDTVMFSGMIFHTTARNKQQLKDEQEILELCLKKILNPNGYLVIVVGFNYGDHPSHSLFVRAEWLHKLVEEKLKTAQGKIVYENMSLQLGLEKKIRQQKVMPDWFVADASADYSNKFAGTYVASWTFVAELSGD